MISIEEIKIKINDLEEKRTVEELIVWVEKVLNNKDKKFVESLRLKATKEIKRFIEEIIPIEIFAKKYFDNLTISIQPDCGNQSYDARVYGCPEISYLEVTRAIDGELEKNRNKEINKNGKVPIWGKCESKGTIASRKKIVKFSIDCVSQTEILSDIKELITIAIKNKIAKKYNKKTFLIVAFEDMFFDTEGLDDDSIIREFVEKEFKNLEHSFVGIAIVGLYGHYYMVI